MAYIDVGKIETLRFMCHKILPLVYDESLSYYETLCKVANKLNECIDNVNQLDDNVDTLNSSVNNLNSRVNQIASEINTFEATILAKFNALEDDVNTTVDQKMSEVDSKIVDMDNKIKQLDNTVDALTQYIEESLAKMTADVQALINDSIAELNQKFDNVENEMRIYIQNQLKTAIRELPDITSVMVIDPTTNLMTSIQTALDNLFFNTRYFALTCDEFNALGLTVDKLNTLPAKSIPRGFTVIEWLTHGKRWLKVNKAHETFSLNGTKECYKKRISENTDLLRVCGAMTMSELGELNITVDEFIALNLTAYDIAWRTNRIFA